METVDCRLQKQILLEKWKNDRSYEMTLCKCKNIATNHHIAKIKKSFKFKRNFH
jgi:hypothetical protein